jgi:hypothetical protein
MHILGICETISAQIKLRKIKQNKEQNSVVLYMVLLSDDDDEDEDEEGGEGGASSSVAMRLGSSRVAHRVVQMFATR